MDSATQGLINLQKYAETASQDGGSTPTTVGHQDLICAKDEHDTTEKNELAGNLPLEKKSKKKYSVISQQVREKFINKVLSKQATIKEVTSNFPLKKLIPTHRQLRNSD